MSILHHQEKAMHVREVKAPTPRGTIVWIHGLGESAFCFEHLWLTPSFAQWHHLAPDLPGYGKSPWAEQPLTLNAFAQHLASWLAGRGTLTPPLIIAGHSMGGVIGTMLCEALAGAGTPADGFLNLEGNISLGDCGFSSRVAHAEPEDGSFQRLVDEVFVDGQKDQALRAYYPSLRFCDPRAYHLNGRELVELSSAEGLAQRLADLNLPILYIYGNPHGTGQRSLELLRNAGIDYRAIADAGHWPFLDQPKAFLQKASEWLISPPFQIVR